ncbi:hypothetical protein [Streptomyces cinereoruber]
MADTAPDTSWAGATETRFTALYRLLVGHPGLIAMCGDRPWLGPQLLRRLVETQLAHSLAADMTPKQAIVTYRRLYLLPLGSASYINHRDPKDSRALTRQALAALDPDDFPVLTRRLGTVGAATADPEVYYGALRQLIDAANRANSSARRPKAIVETSQVHGKRDREEAGPTSTVRRYFATLPPSSPQRSLFGLFPNLLPAGLLPP